MFTPAEVDDIIKIGYLNGLFVLARSIGLIGERDVSRGLRPRRVHSSRHYWAVWARAICACLGCPLVGAHVCVCVCGMGGGGRGWGGGVESCCDGGLMGRAGYGCSAFSAMPTLRRRRCLSLLPSVGITSECCATLCCAGHALDQKRLQQPLYRHPWDDVLYTK